MSQTISTFDDEDTQPFTRLPLDDDELTCDSDWYWSDAESTSADLTT